MQASQDCAFLRRNRKGARSVDLWNWPIEPFNEKKGAFAVQQFIQEMIRNDPSNITQIITQPPDVDTPVWLYEHVRQFVLELNLLIVQLQGICTSIECPSMKVTEEWLFLCAVHQKAKECSAIDYMIHTLDWASMMLHSSKNFQSRVSITPRQLGVLKDIVRRLYRLFAHTYHHHRELFFDFEREMHLCERFTEFMTMYEMMAPKLITIPLEDLRFSK